MARSHSLPVCLLITSMFVLLLIFPDNYNPAMGYDLLLPNVISFYNHTQKKSTVSRDNKLKSPNRTYSASAALTADVLGASVEVLVPCDVVSVLAGTLIEGTNKSSTSICCCCCINGCFVQVHFIELIL